MKPSYTRSIYLALCITLTSTSAVAGLFADEMGKCLVKSTTAADRNVLVQWIFAGFSSHPETKSLSLISDTQREELDKKIAKLIETLLTESCKKETQDAIQYEGPKVFESSFAVLGTVAGNELYANPSVAASMSTFSKYLNKQKVIELFATTPKAE